MSKPIPKSLHTVTTLRRLAAPGVLPGWTDRTPAESIQEALRVLGYTNTPDTHELAAKALEMLEREARK